MSRQLLCVLLITAMFFFSYNTQVLAQVENDEPENAIELMIGTNGPFTNVDATPNVDDLVGGECGNNGNGDGWFEPNVDNSVWFTYVGNGGEVILESGTGCGDDGSNGDTQFALYEGSADGPLVVCNDDISGGVYYSSITFFAEEDVTYFLLVDGWDGTVGEFCIEANAVGCGNGVCESNETFENCLADCPCTPNASWAGNLGDFYLECVSENTIAIPIGILGAGETDDLYAVTTNIGTLSADTIETVTLTEIYITQAELDASDGQLLVTFDGVGFDGQCMDILQVDLIAEMGGDGDIAAICEGINPCQAGAGTIDVLPETLCIDDDFLVIATGMNSDSSYLNGFLLTAPFDSVDDPTNLTIYQVSSDGVFTADTIGAFSVITFSLLESQLATPIESLIGLNINLIGTAVPCFDYNIALEGNIISILDDENTLCNDCAISAGSISTLDSTTICVSDSIPDIINVTAVDNDSENYTYILSNQDGSIFLAGPNEEGVFDFNNVTAGVCQIWGIAYDGEITLPNPNDSLFIQGECYELSNAIEVLREDCPEVGIINIRGFENGLIINEIGPIPGTNQLFLSFVLSSNTENTVISIFDFSGKKMEEINRGQGLLGYNTMSLDISQLVAGMYVLQLTDGRMVDTVRFIKE